MGKIDLKSQYEDFAPLLPQYLYYDCLAAILMVSGVIVTFSLNVSGIDMKKAG